MLRLHRVNNLCGPVSQDSAREQRCSSCDRVLLGVAGFLLICFFHGTRWVGWGTDNYWEPVVHLLPQGQRGGGDEAAVGWHAKWNVHTCSACLNSSIRDLSCREVGDCSTSLLIRMPLLCLWGLCLLLFPSTLPGFAWFPHLVLICSVAPQWEKSALAGLWGKNNRMAVQFDVSSIWVSFILNTSQWVVRGLYH